MSVLIFDIKKRFFIYIIGLFVLSLGIAISIRSQLGVSPVSSIPYVISSITGMTIGTITFFFFLVCVLSQIVILGKAYKPRDLLQIIFSSVFGLFTDLSLYLTTNLATPNYLVQLLFLVISLLLIGIGISLVLITDIIIMAPEGLCRVISVKWEIEFSKIKTIFDISCVLISIIIAMTFLDGVTQIREGTIIAALTIGKIVGVFLERYKDKVQSFYIK